MGEYILDTIAWEVSDQNTAVFDLAIVSVAFCGSVKEGCRSSNFHSSFSADSGLRSINAWHP